MFFSRKHKSNIRVFISKNKSDKNEKKSANYRTDFTVGCLQ